MTKTIKTPAKKPAAKRAPAKPADPTLATYTTLSKAFDHFNRTLFDGRLPPAMIVTHRKRHAHGYFWRDMWSQQGNKEAHLSEIALNPESMGRSAKDVLSTLVHEMVHHEQHVFGKPSKSGHNVEWCQWMERIDLTPVGIGNCAGKRSGRNFTHEIIEGGKFDTACDALLKAKGFDLSWFAKRPGSLLRGRDPSKVKHTCPDCGLNVWGKQGLMVICVECNQMLAAAW